MATVSYWSRACRDCEIWQGGRDVPLNVAARDAEAHHTLLGHTAWIWRARSPLTGGPGPVWQLPAPPTGTPGLF